MQELCAAITSYVLLPLLFAPPMFASPTHIHTKPTSYKPLQPIVAAACSDLPMTKREDGPRAKMTTFCRETASVGSIVNSSSLNSSVGKVLRFLSNDEQYSTLNTRTLLLALCRFSYLQHVRFRWSRSVLQRQLRRCRRGTRGRRWTEADPDQEAVPWISSAVQGWNRSHRFHIQIQVRSIDQAIQVPRLVDR